MQRTVVVDAVCAGIAGASGYVWRFGGREVEPTGFSFWFATSLPVVWMVALLVARAYEQRFLWVGAEEFRRVLLAGMVLLATVGTVSWALKLQVARGFVVVALPLATVLTLAGRVLHRKWLHRRRSRGHCRQTTVLVGHRGTVASLDSQIGSAGYHGYQVIGCCLPADEQQPGADAFNGLPVLGGLEDVVDVVDRYEIDTVAVLPCPELDGPALRRLGWALERTQAELLLAPAITEIVGTRVAIRPVCGLPLLHVERPELTGVRRLTKSIVDLVGSAVLLLVLAPLMVGIAIALRCTSRGPVLYTQQRIGRDGRPFSMYKFRSMVEGAELMVAGLATTSDGNGVLFKLRDDPRVTRLGKFLRRYSLDELPQLVNVVTGSMSLVGPRPPLPSEVARYGCDMHRRFLVKPGLTGLWQVSGRSDLSWDETVSIDLRYVENWSLLFDFMILWKTVGAVLRGPGAY